MNKEDLIEYKKKINNLTEEELKLRDEYLKKIASGECLGPKTGYSFIDKPQLLGYDYTEDRFPSTKYDCIYDMVFKDKDPNKEAISYLNGQCVWTYKKLQKETNKYIQKFKNEGIKLGDNVLIGTIATPELVAVVIALISIGAVTKFYDIRANAKEIAEYANSSKCKYAIAFEQIVMPKINEVVDETNLKKVFVLRPSNSMSLNEKLSYLKKHNFKIDPKIEIPTDKRFDELNNKVLMYSKNPKIIVNPEKCAIKVQSSGTTGKPKTIVHKEKSMLEFARSTRHVDVPLGEGKTVFVALPPWIAYGICDAILNPLICNTKIELSTDFEPNAVYRNIGRFTMCYAAPFHYRYIRDNYKNLSEENKEELSKVDTLVSGGDKYTAKENKDDEDLFRTNIGNGYGNNEDLGCLTANPWKRNRYGSVGIPKYGETVIIYDENIGTDLQYNQVGEICTLSKTTFAEYEGNEDATRKVLRKHEDGNTYLHTGDLGYLDEDGYLYILGRNERVITRLGFKLSAYSIEDSICNFDVVKECIAIEVPDEVEEHVPMVFVVPKDDIKFSKHEIELLVEDYCKKNMKENEIPKYIMVVDHLEYTDNNKYNFRKYEEIGKNFVEENNKKILRKSF